MNRTSEAEIALAIVRVLRRAADKRATMEEIRAGVPRVVRLTKGDRAESTTRPGEPLWHQVVRNVRSHNSGRKYGLRNCPGGFVLESKPAQHVKVRLAGLAGEARHACH